MNNKLIDIVSVHQDVRFCSKCGLCSGKHVVHEGHPNAEIMFVGEAPGTEETRLRRPFVGPAGQLFDKILEAAQLKRNEVFITNVVRCQPPGNRTPTTDEIKMCRQHLFKEIAIVQPKIIIALGATAASALIQDDFKITSGRGKIYDYKGIKVIPTFHPAYLLRLKDITQKRAKALVWRDICLALTTVGRSV